MKTPMPADAVICILCSAFCLSVCAQPSNFTCQGVLTDSGVPVTGTYDFLFVIYNGPDYGAPGISALQSSEVMDVGVSNGLFTADIPFQSWVLNGDPRWLEVQVRTNDSGSYTGLLPWTEITPAPYAVRALYVSSNALVDYGEMVSLTNPSNLFVGDGSGLTGVTLDGATASDFWQLDGNSGTTVGLDFLGTTDGQPLEFRVNNSRGWRLEPTAADGDHAGMVNVVGGSPANVVGSGVYGAVIAGGGAVNFFGHTVTHNGVDADLGTIGGGIANTIQSGAFYSTIGGGGDNTIEPLAAGSTIGGGHNNAIGTNAYYSTVSGGTLNSIHAQSYFATICGGQTNTIEKDASCSSIGGGRTNMIRTNADYSTIGGGLNNTIWPNASFATIPGGELNAATNYAFAAGRGAKANHTGAFVWADSTAADFPSTANNQFAARASGGVRFQSPRLEVTGSGNEQAYIGGDGTGGDVEIGSRNASIMNVGFWNSAAASHMNLYALTVTETSDRNAKENFQAIDPGQVLEKVTGLPLSEWNYKADTATRHIGPMAQDFHAAFGVGPDDRHIATVDADGVALAAIQGLNEKVERGARNARHEIRALKAENDELKQKVEMQQRQLREIRDIVNTLDQKENAQ